MDKIIIILAVLVILILAATIIFLWALNSRKKLQIEQCESQVDDFTQKNNKMNIIKSELEKIAYYDEITGLYNMSKFSLESKRILDENPEANYAITIFEIDNIKKINMLYGLEESDRVKRYVASCLKRILSSDYIYAKIHEDLFAVISLCDDEDEVTNLVELLSNEIINYSTNFQVHMSFGVYKITDREMPVSQMTNLAELAKRTIPNDPEINYAFYTDALNTRLIEDKQMGAEMDYALEHHQFIMFLQPMINLRTHQIVGAEALVRWDHPSKGILSPFKFIPLFESNNFIIKLDHYIWTDAFKTIRHWIDNNIEPIPISINISPIHFEHPGFVDKLCDLAERFRIPKDMIELELPERAFSETTDIIVSTMNRLNEAGFPLCIDNFGSYHSPINLLRDLPISVIKLDRNFLNRNLTSLEGLTIVRYLNAMAKELNKNVIAEGVETIEQANHLMEIGCDFAQGFFFAKPIPLRDFDALRKKVLRENYTPSILYPTFDDSGKDLLP